MSSVEPKILSKIKKCLALATSDNPNEAATAMRQARALMDKHGISTQEITMADIGESSLPSKTMARDKPARWEAELAATVGKAFGCKMMVSHMVMKRGRGHLNEGQFIYVGLKQQAEVAAYTATVLIRKCKKARAQWISTTFEGIPVQGVPGSKRKMTRMGDAFAEGWVHAITKLVHEFALTKDIGDAIDQHIEKRASGGEARARAMKDSEIGAHERYAAAAGIEAAKGESLYRPMNTDEAPLALAGA